MTVVAGVDFGTASVRVAIVDSARGRLGSSTAPLAVYRRSDDPDHATQRHEDHLLALESAFAAALADAGVEGRTIAALAVATTGSTVTFLDDRLRPIDDYYLWSDHRAWREAAAITEQGRTDRLAALDYCGGSYSPEWGFAKLLHWRRQRPDLWSRCATAAEHCDVIVATLCGITDPDRLPRSICAMGHKWLWNRALGGLPPEEFLAGIDPLLAGVRDRIGGIFASSAAIAGGLSDAWAARLSLTPGIPVPVGALDAHWDAIGAGCRIGDVVNVIGTSSCIMALSQEAQPIPGINGVVPGSIHPDLVGIEAGLAAVGDLFDAIARRARSDVATLAAAVEDYEAGQSGLLRLCWDKGDRSVRGDSLLTGATIGWRLHHEPQDELHAAMEGTGYHSRIVLDRMAAHGTPIDRVINGGGIPRRSNALNRAYASILNKPVLIPESDTTGLGSAIFAFLAAGAFPSLAQAQDALCPRYRVVEPQPDAVARYEELFGTFSEAYFSDCIPILRRPAD